MNYGYQNEIDFVELFNNKYVYELDGILLKRVLLIIGEVRCEARTRDNEIPVIVS